MPATAATCSTVNGQAGSGLAGAGAACEAGAAAADALTSLPPTPAPTDISTTPTPIDRNRPDFFIPSSLAADLTDVDRPHAAPMRADHEHAVAGMDDEVHHVHRRQIAAEHFPSRA